MNERDAASVLSPPEGQEPPQADMPQTNCPHCGRKVTMRTITERDAHVADSPLLLFLVELFTPGIAVLDQRYECPRCRYTYKNVTLARAVLLPLVLITLTVASVLVFLYLVFFLVSR